MDDGESTPPAAMGREMPYMPHAIVSEILARLPVKSLMRFSCVCKAWHSTMCGDASFHRAHLRLQKPCLLVSPNTLDDDVRQHLHIDKVALYMWEANQQGTTLPLVYATDLLSDLSMNVLAHCDGLVLLYAESAVHVLNPATRHSQTLPRSCSAEPPCQGALGTETCHEAFGLGHDPRAGAYKVARFSYSYSYRSLDNLEVMAHYHSIKMEVFTIGTDRHWRETLTQPPYPTVAQRTATFFRGSLIWTLSGDTPGFLRFRLGDESFEVMHPPPCHLRLVYVLSRLGELSGELCLACRGADINSTELWMYDNVDKPRWVMRYTIDVCGFGPPNCYPVATFEDEIVFNDYVHGTRRYNLRTKSYSNMFCMEDLRHHKPSTSTPEEFFYFDVIPYTPSLIPI